MNQEMEIKTKVAVQMLLEGVDEAAVLAGEIDEQTRKACQMICAAEARCAKACEAMLTDNPSRDMTGADALLARELYRLDAYMDDSRHGKPAGKGMDTSFWKALAKARGAQLPQEEIKPLLSEVMTRNALYQALDDNAMDARDADAAERFVSEDMHRECAYAVAVQIKYVYGTGQDELALLALKTCLAYRLDYLDRGKIKETDAQLASLMKQRAKEAAAEQEDEPKADEKEERLRGVGLLPLCAACLAGAAAIKLLSPTGAVMGAAAAALAYLFLR